MKVTFSKFHRGLFFVLSLSYCFINLASAAPPHIQSANGSIFTDAGAYIIEGHGKPGEENKYLLQGSRDPDGVVWYDVVRFPSVLPYLTNYHGARRYCSDPENPAVRLPSVSDLKRLRKYLGYYIHPTLGMAGYAIPIGYRTPIQFRPYHAYKIWAYDAQYLKGFVLNGPTGKIEEVDQESENAVVCISD